MRIACLTAACLLLASPAALADPYRGHQRPHYAAPRHYAPARRVARPIARRLVGGYGYGGIQLIGRVRGPRPLIPTGYQVPGGTFYINNSGYVGGITFDNGRPAALPKIFWDRFDRESGGTAQ